MPSPRERTRMSQKRLEVHAAPRERSSQSVDDVKHRPQRWMEPTDAMRHPCHVCDIIDACRSALETWRHELHPGHSPAKARVAYHCPQPHWRQDNRTRADFEGLPNPFSFMSFHHKWQIEDLIGCELRLAPRPLLEEVVNYLRCGIIVLHQHPPMRPPLVMKHHRHPQPQYHLPSRSCSTSTMLATSSPMVWPVNNSVVTELWAKPTHDFRQHPKWDVESAFLRNTLILQPHEKHKSPVNSFPQEDLYDSDSVDNQHHCKGNLTNRLNVVPIALSNISRRIPGATPSGVPRDGPMNQLTRLTTPDELAKGNPKIN